MIDTAAVAEPGVTQIALAASRHPRFTRPCTGETIETDKAGNETKRIACDGICTQSRHRHRQFEVDISRRDGEPTLVAKVKQGTWVYVWKCDRPCTGEDGIPGEYYDVRMRSVLGLKRKDPTDRVEMVSEFTQAACRPLGEGHPEASRFKDWEDDDRVVG